MNKSVTFHESGGRIGEERAMHLVEKELALLRAQHRADVAELREESEVSRAHLSALIAETKSTLRSTHNAADNSRFVLTVLLFLIAAMIGGFLYVNEKVEDQLREQIADLEDQISIVTGAPLVAPARAAPRAAPVEEDEDTLARTHVRRAPRSDD